MFTPNFTLNGLILSVSGMRFFMQFFVIQGEPLPCPEVRRRPGGKIRPPRRGGTAILSIDENTR